MPRRPNCVPNYTHHRPSGQARCRWRSVDYYLGNWDSPESKRLYSRLLRWIETGNVPLTWRNGDPNEAGASDRTAAELAAPPAGITVLELIDKYLKWADDYYRRSQQVQLIEASVKPLRELYGITPVAEFGPKRLKAVRERMIAAGLSRQGINKRIGCVRRVFRWAAEEELAPRDLYHSLQAVRPLSYGRTEAPESDPVKPVPLAWVEAIQPHVAPQIWAMVQLQLLTGARPGEIAQMRTCDIDVSGRIWIYRPCQHKTLHHGHDREILLGPKAQTVLRPWLRTELQATLFQPKEAAEWHFQQRAQARKTPASCGNRRGSRASRRLRPAARPPGEVYHVHEYRRAIHRGCDKAFPPEETLSPRERRKWQSDHRWSPNQLRHSAATEIRRRFGIEHAQACLGHKTLDATQIYAEKNRQLAEQVVSALG